MSSVKEIYVNTKAINYITQSKRLTMLNKAKLLASNASILPVLQPSMMFTNNKKASRNNFKILLWFS